MIIFIRSLVIAVLIGLLGFVVFFSFGSVSGRGEIGVAATGIFLLFSGVFLVQKYPANRWYGGALINIPIWLVFGFWADAGQLEMYFWALVGCLIVSYAGTVIGLWVLKRKIVISKRMKVMLVVLPLVLIVLTTYILNTPKPIPADKEMFVGVWKSGLGFELHIMANGTATITQNVEDKGSDYENLNIQVAPAYISTANVEFLGDSILFIVRRAYYARQYRIDKFPYRDSTQYKIVLNGVTLIKQ